MRHTETGSETRTQASPESRETAWLAQLNFRDNGFDATTRICLENQREPQLGNECESDVSAEREHQERESQTRTSRRAGAEKDKASSSETESGRAHRTFTGRRRSLDLAEKPPGPASRASGSAVSATAASRQSTRPDGDGARVPSVRGLLANSTPSKACLHNGGGGTKTFPHRHGENSLLDLPSRNKRGISEAQVRKH